MINMLAVIVWTISTAAFWFLSNLTSNAVEAHVHNYVARTAVMAAGGIAIGALASAVGYGFFILTVLLVLQLLSVRRRMQVTFLVSSQIATKYVLPAFILVAFATVASYVFAIETCSPTEQLCKRLFFERIYTPPHLDMQAN